MTLSLVTGAGCANVVRQYTETEPIRLSPAPTLAEVARAVNENSAKVRSLKAPNAEIRLPGAPRLSAGIALERDRRFRLKAEMSLIGPVVDLGSNDQMLWLWMRGLQPPTTFYCRHERFAASTVGRQVPIHPEWLIDAMGMATFHPTDAHSGPYPTADGRLEVRSEVSTPAGPMRKVTIVDRQRAWVLEQRLYDPAGQLVASSTTSRHLRDPLSGATLPRKIEIHWPHQQFVLNISLGDVQVNYLGDNPQALWTMPNYEGNTLVDLSNPNLRIPSLSPRLDLPETTPAKRPSSKIGFRPDQWLRRLLPH